MGLESARGIRKIYDRHSKYQHIEVWEDELGLGRILTLDSKIQLTTYDQHRYHECLGVIPYLFTKHARRVAILGGGDGYVARLLLALFPVERVTLVDIDPEVIETGRAFFEFPEDDRLEIIHADAADWVRGDVVDADTARGYDLVIADYTDPTSPYSVSLYTIEHFEDIRKGRLSDRGVFATQMASPYANPKAAGCLILTMMRAFPKHIVYPYKIHLPMQPAPGQNGFLLAAPGPMQMPLPGGLMYLNPASLQSVFLLGNDEMYDLEAVIPSTRQAPMYAQLYKRTYSRDTAEWEVQINEDQAGVQDKDTEAV